MKIVFSSRPAFGHVFAIAPLARAAQEAGHDVIFASGGSFLPRLEAWGFRTAKVGEAIEWGFERAAAQFPQLLQPEVPAFGGRMFVDVLGPRTAEDLRLVLAEERPDVVVYEATDVGAAVAAAEAGIPAVCHSLSVWADAFSDALRERESALWKAGPALDYTVGDVFLDIWPPSMQPAGAATGSKEHWSLRPDSWGDPSAEVPSWMDSADGPLIFVSLGTVFWGKELLGKVIDALDEMECEALILAGVDATPDDLPTKSPRLHVSGFVNQREVLRRVDLVIHHGGAGTMLGALSQGLPALALAQGADRPFTAASLVGRGAGLCLVPQEATPGDIADAVQTLLAESRYRESAMEVQKEIEAMPSPADTVARLESHLSAG